MSDSTDVPPASGEAAPIRQTVLYSGRVQGVGFRATVARIAGRFDLPGFVQNLPDGRVRLIVEGQPVEVDLFLGSVATTMNAYIGNQHRTESMATGEFVRFFIKRTGFH